MNNDFQNIPLLEKKKLKMHTVFILILYFDFTIGAFNMKNAVCNEPLCAERM